MRIKIMLLLLWMSVSVSVALGQSFEVVNGDTVNLRDSNDQKQGWWMTFNHDGKYKGYEVDQLVEEGEYLNNKKTGIWTKYYPNGNKKHELTMANNIPNGYAKIYYRSGKLQEEGIWKMNRWSGQYKYYYEDGTTKYDWSYNSSGKREGEQKYFHENGMLQYLGDWKGGKESGELTEYYEDGSIKAKRFFDNGAVIPEKTEELVRGKAYDDNIKMYTGRPARKEYQRGELIDGYNKTVNKDGTVSKEGIFKDKRLIDGTVYEYENGAVVRTITYQGGKRTGEEPTE